MVKQFYKLILMLIMIPMASLAEESKVEGGKVDTYIAGTHYVELAEQIAVRNPDKIEVTEVFWYGCGHCYRFESSLHKWEKTLGSDVEFVRSPAMWNDKMNIHARAYYTAEALGKLDVMHTAIFEAMHKDRKKLATEREIARVFTAQGVNKEEFSRAFNSFGVQSSVRQADARARSYQITGTPELVVNGKYRVGSKLAGGQDKILKVIDFLIEKERALRKKP